MTEKMDSQIRREQIAEAALSIIAGQGVSAVTVRKVAQLVGLTPPALYRHFRDKTAILDAVLDLLRESFRENVHKARAESSAPLAVLRNVLLHNVRLIQRYRVIPLVFLSDYFWHENPMLSEKLRKNFNAFRSEIACIFSEAQELGQVRKDIKTEELVIAFLGLYGLPSMLANRALVNLDLTAMVDANWKIFERGIAPWFRDDECGM